MTNTFIHYGHRHYNKNIFVDIYNDPRSCKPRGGLWASRIDAPKSWKWWCEVEEYPYFRPDKWFKFIIKEDANILTINRTEMLKDLPKLPHDPYMHLSFHTYLDFEELRKEYDAVEVLISEDDELYNQMFCWDCDSIVILNKEIVEEIDSSENYNKIGGEQKAWRL